MSCVVKMQEKPNIDEKEDLIIGTDIRNKTVILLKYFIL
jgi:hypothetical protein